MNIKEIAKKVLEHYGCLTGDCPHDKWVDCFYSAIEFFFQCQLENLQPIDVYGLKKYSALDVSRRNLEAHRDRFKNGVEVHQYFDVEEVKAYLLLYSLWPNKDNDVDKFKQEANEWKRQHRLETTARFAAEDEIEKLRKEIAELKKVNL